MSNHHVANVALLLAWALGAVLAVLAPGWPFPGCPVVILLASSLAWQVSVHGLGRPSAIMLVAGGATSALLTTTALAAHAAGRVPLGFALGVSAIAILLSALFCLCGPGRRARA